MTREQSQQILKTLAITADSLLKEMGLSNHLMVLAIMLDHEGSVDFVNNYNNDELVAKSFASAITGDEGVLTQVGPMFNSENEKS